MDLDNRITAAVFDVLDADRTPIHNRHGDCVSIGEDMAPSAMRALARRIAGRIQQTFRVEDIAALAAIEEWEAAERRIPSPSADMVRRALEPDPDR